MTAREALLKMTLPRLRAIVKKYDADVIISKYSTMKKKDLVERMLEKDVMKKLRGAEEIKAPEKKPRMKKEEKKKEEKPVAKKEEDKPQVVAPRNLTKGFGIRRTVKKSKVDDILKLIEDSKDMDRSELPALIRLIKSRIASRELSSEVIKRLSDALEKSPIASNIDLTEKKDIVGKQENKLSGIVSMRGEDIDKLKEALPLFTKLLKEESKGEKQKIRNAIVKSLSGYKGEAMRLPGVPTDKVYTKAFKDKLPKKISMVGFSMKDAVKEWKKNNER